MKRLFFVFLAALVVNSVQLAHAGDIAAGKKKTALCASCHGVNGIATLPIYPNLAGQNEAYLISALTAYRDKQRNGGMAAIMQMQAANLSDTDIENIAAYFSSLK
ncbi:MAG: cytochrome c [Proteobacteria bacterium]|nr:cytochrome c [Pseudomonadota bacterium]